jgi:alkylation response protein AidB-like acyl-CoA dehydrogenase
MGLAAVSDGSKNNQPPICVYFAREQVTIHDTWHVSGLRGTGSSDFEVKNAFVPTEHTHSFLGSEPCQPGIIYRIPGLTIFPWSITGAPLGIADGAITAFTKSATQKKIRLDPAAGSRNGAFVSWSSEGHYRRRAGIPQGSHD